MENRTAFIRTRMDPALKSEVESLLHVWGITTTQAIDMFYRQIRRTHKFPLDLSFNAETDRVIKEVKQGRGVKAYKNANEMFKALDMLPRDSRSVKKIQNRTHLKRRPAQSR